MTVHNLRQDPPPAPEGFQALEWCFMLVTCIETLLQADELGGKHREFARRYAQRLVQEYQEAIR